VHAYLQETIAAATRSVFAAMAGIAAVALLVVFIMPRRLAALERPRDAGA
jgi:hypothetical protein